MFYTSSNTSNTSNAQTRNGLASTTGVSVRNHRIKNRRAKDHKGYSEGPISETFNVYNSDSWYVSYPEFDENNMTITLSNGKWQGNTLKNDTEDVNTIYFTWSDITTVTQNISEINDSNNTITWKTLDSATNQAYTNENYTYTTIIWTRL
tara:strand:- start:314 stop:763 length:450 start_codon:yes stop_codon:yes gene_type:complete